MCQNYFGPWGYGSEIFSTRSEIFRKHEESIRDTVMNSREIIEIYNEVLKIAFQRTTYKNDQQSEP